MICIYHSTLCLSIFHPRKIKNSLHSRLGILGLRIDAILRFKLHAKWRHNGACQLEPKKNILPICSSISSLKIAQTFHSNSNFFRNRPPPPLPPWCAFYLFECFQGPPGTGKSTTIAAMIGQLFARWSAVNLPNIPYPRILLTAPSNAAVDELVSLTIITSKPA